MDNYTIYYVNGTLTVEIATLIPILRTQVDLKVYPNPFADRVYFDLNSSDNAKVIIEIFDMKGIKLATLLNNNVVNGGIYRFEYVPENVSSGFLFYRLIIDGKLIQSGKIIHK